MSRCILSVATGPYLPLQERLLASLRAVGWADVAAWTSEFPPGSRGHEEVPYGFKLRAFREAERRGATSLLWLDSPVVAAKPPGPVFDRLESEGHLFTTSGERIGNWANDVCLDAFEISRDRAMDLPLLNGTFIGLDLKKAAARAWLDEMEKAAARGLFAGPYFTPAAPAEARARKPGRSVGPASSDPRCWGHRHDEAVGSCLAWKSGLKIAAAPELFGPDGLFKQA
jgi:hypothetical protein